MTFKVCRDNLFNYTDTHYLAHCVSADFALGAGIAVEFNKRFNMRAKLHSLPKECREVGKAILCDKVFNLITKEKYSGKPSYTSLFSTLIDMRDQCVHKGITKLAMPMIGCGLDKLSWDRAYYLIQNTFKDTDIDIIVCYL